MGRTLVRTHPWKIRHLMGRDRRVGRYAREVIVISQEEIICLQAMGDALQELGYALTTGDVIGVAEEGWQEGERVLRRATVVHNTRRKILDTIGWADSVEGVTYREIYRVCSAAQRAELKEQLRYLADRGDIHYRKHRRRWFAGPAT